MKSKKLEMWGLVLILLSSFVQFFILSKSQNLTNGAVIYKLETKLDRIFMASRSNFQTLQPEPLKTMVKVNPEAFDSYEYAEQNKSMAETKMQTELFGDVVTVLFLIGSGLIILAKKMEIDALEKTTP
ncbi:hypothetical protein [Shewanella sp.]|uniref:hypothetical protein n=1 Tax=Shewanella sp. TaxID=50422 RepID=UPI003A97B33A